MEMNEKKDLRFNERVSALKKLGFEYKRGAGESLSKFRIFGITTGITVDIIYELNSTDYTINVMEYARNALVARLIDSENYISKKLAEVEIFGEDGESDKLAEATE
jgi:hypothetical protein